LSKTAFKDKYRKIKGVCQGFAVIFVVFLRKSGVFRLKLRVSSSNLAINISSHAYRFAILVIQLLIHKEAVFLIKIPNIRIVFNIGIYREETSSYALLVASSSKITGNTYHKPSYAFVSFLKNRRNCQLGYFNSRNGFEWITQFIILLSVMYHSHNQFMFPFKFLYFLWAWCSANFSYNLPDNIFIPNNGCLYRFNSNCHDCLRKKIYYKYSKKLEEKDKKNEKTAFCKQVLTVFWKKCEGLCRELER